jgi:DNA polymerase epsilon subunit 1
VLSKDIKDYGESKGVAINSAKRLAEFLGPEVIKGKTGLTCYFVISSLPANKPVT